MDNLNAYNIACFVLESEKDSSGNYRVLIAQRDKPGYFLTDVTAGKDFGKAEAQVKQLNLRHGLNDKEATDIIMSTMIKQKNMAMGKLVAEYTVIECSQGDEIRRYSPMPYAELRKWAEKMYPDHSWPKKEELFVDELSKHDPSGLKIETKNVLATRIPRTRGKARDTGDLAER